MNIKHIENSSYFLFTLSVKRQNQGGVFEVCSKFLTPPLVRLILRYFACQSRAILFSCRKVRGAKMESQGQPCLKGLPSLDLGATAIQNGRTMFEILFLRILASFLTEFYALIFPKVCSKLDVVNIPFSVQSISTCAFEKMPNYDQKV